MSALDEYIAISFHGEKWSDMTLLEQANLHEQAAAELAELRAANKRMSEIIELIDAHDDSTSPFVEITKLREELAKRPVRVMAEAEYKDYLSEQDRIKRQEEEQR